MSSLNSDSSAVPGRRVRGDRGAAATLVAILLAGGVLLGMTALVVDVGQLYAEREELQSGADSAAFAIALDCAMDRTACNDAEDTAQTYAVSNARDGASGVPLVCGSEPGGRLDPCPPPTGNLTDCLGDPPTGGAAYVEVRTSTMTADGSTLLPPSFAQTLVGGYQGTTVGACARVAWGSPAGGLAVTLSQCEWEGATNNGTDYPPPDATDAELGAHEVIIHLHDSHGNALCFNGPPNFDGPGGFGWLDGDDCLVEIDDTYKGDPGNQPGDCSSVIPALRDNRTPVVIPIYDTVTPPPPGPGLNYELLRLEVFVVTGYRLTGSPAMTASSSLGTGASCSGSERCLIGYFLEPGLVDWDGAIGDPSIPGPMVVRTIG
jgi:Flp pilus assembly protein TadG